jgi:hemoglobin
MSEEVTTTASLFEQLGGAPAVAAAVEIFYRKVLEDYRINRFFDKVDTEKLIAKQKTFFTMAFGGPNYYTGLDLRKAHEHLVKIGLNDDHFDVVMEHLGATLTELNVPEALLAQVMVIAEGARNDVLGK